MASNFENAVEIVIDEDGSVDCNVSNNLRVYWCDAKFEWETIDDISRIINYVSNLIDHSITNIS